MSRKKQAPKRIFYPDTKYSSLVLAKFINFVMYDGKKSIAFNVILEPKDKTLSDKDIDQISKKIILTVQESTGATLRS